MPELTPIAQVLLGKLLKTTLFILAVVVALASAGIDMSVLAVGVGVGLAEDALQPVQRLHPVARQVDQAGRRDRGRRHLWLGLVAGRALCLGGDPRRYRVGTVEKLGVSR